jgi:anti-anti-sigma factor
MDCIVKRVDTALKVTMKGKCTFSDYTHFKTIVEHIETGSLSQVDVDLAQLEYVDSSGLGMLLMLNEKSGGKSEIRLISPQGQVKKMIDVARLGNVFTVIA